MSKKYPGLGTNIGVGDLPAFRLEKFIHGVVTKLIRSYGMADFVVEYATGGLDADARQDMIQTAWCAALKCQQSHPKESKNPHYLRRAIVNSLLKFEQSDRSRRDTRDDLEEAVAVPATPTVDFTSYDLSLLAAKADLTPAETTAIELFYGLTDRGVCTIPLISRLMGHSTDWVTSRISVGKLKLQVAAGR